MICHLSISQPFWRWGELVFSSLLSCQVQHRPCLCLKAGLTASYCRRMNHLQTSTTSLTQKRYTSFHAMTSSSEARTKVKSKELFLRSSFFFFQMKTFSLWVSTTSRTSKVHSLDLKKGIEDHVKAEEKSIEEKQLFPTIDFRSRICYLHRFWTEKMAKVH